MILFDTNYKPVQIKRRKQSLAYKNGKDILPSRLLKELQKYTQGELIYIPKEDKVRAGWGENNGTRDYIASRNHEIYMLYKNGYSVNELTDKYSLSEDSIRKIISKTNKELTTQAI